MPKVELHNSQGHKVSMLDLDEAIFGAEIKEHVLYAVVRYQLAKRRAGTHKAKTRAEVSGGGAKPFRQKGTGRARQGTTRAPHWRGGGVAFGPSPRNHGFKINKKVRRAALCSALSRRVMDQRVVVLEQLEFSTIKTRHVKTLLETLGMGDMLLVLEQCDEIISRSARNLPNVTIVPAAGLNVYDILRRDNLVLTVGAVAAITSRLSR